MNYTPYFIDIGFAESFTGVHRRYTPQENIRPAGLRKTKK